MSGSDDTKRGVGGKRPDREAMTGVNIPRRWRGKHRAEQPVVPSARFTSYYGKPILNQPVWESPDIPGYLFLGGLAGGASLLAAGSDLTGRGMLGRTAKTSAAAAGGLSLVALVHDLGRRTRFLNMLRVFKVTSPMSVGSWLLAAYVPAAGVAALTALTGRARWLGHAATAGSALLGPGVAGYTAALIANTAVPAWHDGYPEMPFVFTGSGMMAAGGLGMVTALLPGTGPGETEPARNLALLGTAMELAASQRMERRIGMVAEPYSQGRGGAYLKTAKTLAALGAAGAVLSRRSRVSAALSGAALVAASAATRWGIYHAGLASAGDPKYTVVPQRQRLDERARAGAVAGGREGALVDDVFTVLAAGLDRVFALSNRLTGGAFRNVGLSSGTRSAGWRSPGRRSAGRRSPSAVASLCNSARCAAVRSVTSLSPFSVSSTRTTRASLSSGRRRTNPPASARSTRPTVLWLCSNR